MTFRQLHQISILVPIALGACSSERPPRAVPEAGSTAAQLTFRLDGGSTARPQSVTVAGSRLQNRGSPGAVFWQIVVTSDSVRVPIRAVRYGTTPAGYATGREPMLLWPGYYEIDVVAGGRHAITYFSIRPDGSVSGDSAAAVVAPAT